MNAFVVKKFLLLIATYAYALVRGGAKCVPQDPKCIYVLQMAKLGDMVCTTPVFHALANRYPEAEIVIVGNAVNEALLAGNTDHTRYVRFPGILRLSRRMRRDGCAVAIVVGPDIASLAAAFFSGTSAVIGPFVEGGRSPLCDIWYRAIARLVIVRPHQMGSYAPREYLRLLEPLGIQTDNTTKHLAYTSEAKTRIDAFLKGEQLREGQSLVGIAPRAGNKVKEWPPERFASVAKTLIQDGARIVLIGSNADTEVAEKVREGAGEPNRIVNACGMFSLDESKALIDSLDLLLGVDTGPIYIAEAFGTPTVDIVGPMDEREQPPIGKRNIALVPPGPREPQLHIMNAHPKDEREARRQVEAISMNTVIDACRSLLRGH